LILIEENGFNLMSDEVVTSEYIIIFVICGPKEKEMFVFWRTGYPLWVVNPFDTAILHFKIVSSQPKAHREVVRKTAEQIPSLWSADEFSCKSHSNRTSFGSANSHQMAWDSACHV